MAKKRTRKPKPPVETPEEAQRARTGVNLNVWLPEDLMAVFEELREEESRTKTAQVAVIFKEYFTKRGRWPRKKESE